MRSLRSAEPPGRWDFEGFGIALLEAQACGKPVIAGLSGGTAETMREAETGTLVACDTPEPLADVVSAFSLTLPAEPPWANPPATGS